ncbi:uncharacterized protein LOC111871969 isoform X2 [Cryptotermes secundus]|uniref:uncharacterized protein LOC111871969 isoform X2 n=1 Tax=Cryptotermes secundus TaxID=105785 RepID=UPI001454CE86|nr:uncharacterized protein LOC111871969 isoform X2 [Cryptotermes secundus]
MRFVSSDIENGETQNDTLTESDKMDISEVSDQVSPLSEQSLSETVDNPAPKDSVPVGFVSLDNASAAVSPTSTNTTTTATANTARDRLDSALSLEGFDLELPTLDTYQEEYVDFPSSPKQLKECLEAHGMAMPLERDSGTTGRSEEEDEEDTSIYQAVLSPDCQDVRLKKEHSEEIISIISEPRLPFENTSSHSQDEFPAGGNKGEDLMGVNGNDNKTSEHSDSLKYRLRRVLTPNPEDAVLPNLYGNRAAIQVLPDTLPQAPPNASLHLTKAVSSHDLKILASRQNNSGTNVNMKSQSELDLRMSSDFNNDSVTEDSGFIFERRDSKRLAKRDFGGRVVEGLFVESPLIRDESSVGKSGLRKIALSQSLKNMDSPTGEDPLIPDENSPSLSLTQDKQDSVAKLEEGLNCTNFNISTASERISQASAIPNKMVTSVDIHNEQRERDTENRPENGTYQPVPKVRTKPLTKTCSTPVSSKNQPFKSPPCPKPRRKWQSLSESNANICSNNSKDIESVEFPRGPVVLLDPIALQHQTSSRGAPNINPDGSVDIRQERPGSLVAPQRGGRRKIRVSADILTGNGSGGDTTVNGDESSGESHLSDMDMMSPDDDPDLDALLSPDLDTPDEMEDSIMERLGEPPPARVPIPELSATEERAEARSWRNVLVAGLERRIDMKVIEPYKRVLSHGGYLSAGSHNAIIVFSACFLPDRSRVDYDYVMDNLFFYVLTTLDELITEDYVLIYLHGATSRSCMPTFSWLKRCYQMIDRRLRKNLKGLYLVHPTFWLKTIVIMTRPFISSKFSRKLNFVDTLAELAEVVPLEQASIPDRVKQLDFELQIRYKKRKGRFW